MAPSAAERLLRHYDVAGRGGAWRGAGAADGYGDSGGWVRAAGLGRGRRAAIYSLIAQFPLDIIRPARKALPLRRLSLSLSLPLHLRSIFFFCPTTLLSLTSKGPKT